MTARHEPRTLLETAVLACHRAGGILLAARAATVRTQSKQGAHDLVTEYDLRAEAAIVETLLARHPDSAVTGEEGGEHGSGAIRWYVDPIDGTNNFAHGLPLFCVSIAAALDGRLVAACVYDPVRDEAFTSVSGALALNGRPVAPTPSAGGPAVLLTDFPRGGSDPGERELALWGRLVREYDVRRLGSSALALAYTAVGRGQLACNLGTRSWDVAAGAALVAAAGGRYRTPGLAEDSPLGERLEAPAFLAYGPGVADSALLEDELTRLGRVLRTGSGEAVR
ncbi:inositol monophosphatase family protein [Streptomyces naphthomycinicus]|uniref:inositol monophosphatase family protein n=1 Tax=Streptomyces naphthomycinicus TaxID=2872625 RepID=UPI001CED53F8|nr:inositol monophosphatase family protein [Streptomyces sp. TML10]